MAEDVVIRLDKSRTFSECRGERQPDDPLYRVHFWQGQTINKAMVLLPFDAAGELIPDDGKTLPYHGIVDGKPVMHHPLYNQAMRELLELKRRRHKAVEAAPEPGEGAGAGKDGDLTDEVNLEAWLRGQTRYNWLILQAAAKKRTHCFFANKTALVVGLVLDEKMIPESELAPDLAALLPARETA